MVESGISRIYDGPLVSADPASYRGIKLSVILHVWFYISMYIDFIACLDLNTLKEKLEDILFNMK